MTSLMSWVRRADVGRGTSGIAAAALLCAVAGCEDRASNTGDTQPIAVTEGGVEILEVVRDEDRRTVEAVIVTGGEERQVTFAPLIDGPLPSGVVVSVTPQRGNEATTLSYGWHEPSGQTWFRQQTGAEWVELARATADGRVVEEYAFNDRSIRLEYADLGPAVVDNSVERYLRGESPSSTNPDVVEFIEQLRAFETFAAQLPSAATLESDDTRLLMSLIADPAFAGAVIGENGGEYVTASRPDALCRFFNVCMAISCRLIAQVHICTVCTAGSLACLFMDFMCQMWCGW